MECDPLIDHATFEELKSAAGADFVGDLISTFLEESPRLLAELRSAHAERAAERFKRAAHSLKSNAQTFGATVLGSQARALEVGGLPDDDSALDALDAAYAEAAAAMMILRHG